jgi:hypothetical protein
MSHRKVGISGGLSLFHIVLTHSLPCAFTHSLAGGQLDETPPSSGFDALPQQQRKGGPANVPLRDPGPGLFQRVESSTKVEPPRGKYNLRAVR